MNTLLTAVLSIALLVTLIGLIPYSIWVIYTAIKKRWRRVGLQIGVPPAVVLALMGILSFINTRAYERDLEGLFDTKVELGKAIFEYHSDRAFNGDGYSISVYELPASIRARFESAEGRLLSEFPKHPSYRNHWNFERWRRSPFDKKFSAYLEFALSESDNGSSPNLPKHLDAVRAALEREGTFYAFFYYLHGENVGNIDFFIVDLHEGRLYQINHNT